MCKDHVVELYDRNAERYDLDRSRAFQERGWLDRFLEHVPRPATILDIGCGVGEPIARYLIERGHQVVGIDSSPAMIDICRARFPDMDWVVCDMRRMSLDSRFDGILAWDSFFHLGMDDQRAMFTKFAAHAGPGAPLMFTSGPEEAEAVGAYHGQPLYHASLGQAEYRRLLGENGFDVRELTVEDPGCGGHTVWLSTMARAGPAPTAHTSGEVVGHDRLPLSG